MDPGHVIQQLMSRDPEHLRKNMSWSVGKGSGVQKVSILYSISNLRNCTVKIKIKKFLIMTSTPFIKELFIKNKIF